MKLLNYACVLCICLLCSITSSAQQLNQSFPVLGLLEKKQTQSAHTHRHSCGNELATKALFQENPDYEKAAKQHQRAVEMVSRLDEKAMQSPQAVIEIPVVVHVIHQGEAVGTGRNISQARIIGQLNTLNLDFRKQNANWATGTPTIFKNAGADVEIHFCLAKTTPTGATTNGIDRQQKTITGADPNTSNIETATTGVKALYNWDPTKYLNIYVLPIPGTDATGGVIGYSYLPFTGVVGNFKDGIVLDYRWFGQTGQAGLSGAGRALTHECGHYFGLPHIWADASDAGGCSADDGIADTPEQNDATANNIAFNCSSGVAPVSCGTQNMYIDYMDYLDDDACYTQFTTGQKAVMRSVLTGTGASFGLANRTALVNNGLTQCSACTMTAATSNITPITCIAAGAATAAATNVPTGNTLTYAWSSGATTATISTTTAGTYTVTITANSTCIATATAVIANTCTTFCDTLSNFAAADSARLYSAGAGNGFVSGSNAYGDLAKADYFDYSAGAHTHIKGVYIAFGYAKDAAPASLINVRVWNANGTAGAPNTVLGTIPVSLTAIKNGITAQQFVQYYEFATPIALAAGKKCYVGVELPTTAGDTLVLITNQIGAMSAGAGTAWEKASNGTWYNYNSASRWGADLAHFIAPVFGTPTNAAFTPIVRTAACNTAITFNSTASTNASIRTWTFAGGTPATSSAVSPTVTYAAAGTYSVLLLTQNGCLTDTALGTVTITCAGCTLTAMASSTATTCGLANGTATASATGGTTPYSYLWSNSATTATISNVAAGTYTVTITAGAACSRTATVTIVSSTALTAVASSTATTCGVANGTATASATGGTTPYTYRWSNNATTATISNVAAGTYTVTITGGAACSRTATVTIATSTSPQVSVSTTATIQGQATGTATATVTGGITPYTYIWNNNAITAAISNLAAGTYTVTVADANGCTKMATAVVTSVVATDNLAGLKNVLLYPNPTANELYLSIDFDTPTAVTMLLTNAIGQVLMQKDLAAQAHTFQTIDLHDQATGIYFLTLKTAQGNLIRKIVVTK